MFGRDISFGSDDSCQVLTEIISAISSNFSCLQLFRLILTSANIPDNVDILRRQCQSKVESK